MYTFGQFVNKAINKVVLIGPSSERYKGGIAQITRCLADRLENNFQVDFFSWYKMYPGFFLKRNFTDNISKMPIGKKNADFILGYFNPFSWFTCATKIRRLDPDIVCFTWIHPVHAPIFILLTLLTKLFCRSQIIYICHNVLPHEMFPGAKILTRLSLSGADRLIVHSRAEFALARKLLRTAAINQLFLPLHDFFSPVPAEKVERDKSPGKHFLYFGTIRPYKGLDLLIEALSLVKKSHPDVHLTIAGELFAEERETSKKKPTSISNPLRLIEELGLQENVDSKIGYIPNEEVSALFSAADAAVFPYRSATQSGPITVAYSHGLPVISTKVGGVEDVVKEGVSGYLAQEASPEEIAKAILRFLQHPVSSESVQNYAKRLSWESYIDTLIYEE